MSTLNKAFLVGKWTHEDWSLELNMFNYLRIEWPNGAKAYGAWVLRDDEVVLTYHHEGDATKHLYFFAVEAIIDDNKIKTRDVERNKEEILTRVID